LPPTPVICFNSPGGDIKGAIRLGQLIRDLNLDTCTEPYYDRVIPGTLGEQETFVNDAICASACLFALVGGVNRFVERTSRIGVHQFYSANGNIGDGSTQTIIVALASYLERMGIDRSLLDIASLIPPQDILWLTPKQLQKFRVDNIVAITTQWTLDAFKDGSVYAHIIYVKPVTQGRVSLLVRKVHDRIFLYVGFTPGHPESDDVESAFDAVSDEAIEVRIDQKRVGLFESVRWRISENTIIASVPLSSSAGEHLLLGRTLEVRVHVPTALSQYDPSIEVPLNAAHAIFAAALK
jgi:hypothetical protein